MSWNPHREAWANGPPPWVVQEWAQADGIQIQPSRLPEIMAAREQEATQRIEKALEELEARGNPGLQPREVPGRIKQSFLTRLFGLHRKVVCVSVEPAWPIGTFQWKHHFRGHKELETGYTASRHVVPMRQAAETDNVDQELCVLRLDKEPHAAGCGRPLETVDIAVSLERFAQTTK